MRLPLERARRQVTTISLLALVACGGSDPASPPTEPPPPSPPPSVVTLTVTPASPSLVAGTTTQLTATPRDGTGAALTRTVTWSSSANAVATVSSSGLVTAISPGSTQISASSEGVSGNVTVTVTPVPVASVTVSDPTPVVPGQSQTLVAMARDASGAALTGRTITWASASNAIATVSDSGTVMAVSAGSVTISATAEGQFAQVSVVVREGGYVTQAGGVVTAATGAVSLTVPAEAVSAAVALTVDSVAAPPAHPRLVAGSAFAIGPEGTAFAQPAQLRIRYGARPPGAIPAQFRLHRWNGTTWQLLSATADTVAAAVTGAISSVGLFALIEIPIPVAVVEVSPGTAELAPDATLQLTATTRSSAGEILSGRDVSWSTSNSAVATISLTGAVTAVAPGTVTMTATSEGQSGSATLTVKAPFAYASLGVGPFHTCALTTEGEAWCWGANGDCELGVQPCTGTRPTPMRVETTLRFATIAPGEDFTCALTAAGAAWCWGRNTAGMLGNSSTTASPTPVPVSGGHTFKSISAGYRHVCALTTAGEPWCWGSNARGQLGDSDNTVPVSAPVRVRGNHVFTTVQVGSQNSCGLTSAGIAWCWGENSDGESGDGTGVDRFAPVRVVGDHVFAAISVGQWHSCGRKSGGALWCWGWNDQGQIGDGTRTSRLAPVAVAQGGDLFASVHAFGWSTCALLASGSAKCWGENAEGQLGINSTVDQLTPTSVNGSLQFTSLTSGVAYHMCGPTTAGVWYCWGWNEDGQIGDGTFVDRREPIVLPLPTVDAVVSAEAAVERALSAPRATSTLKRKPGSR